jgi:uncharacterized RDD family membrane protein YckC
VQIYLEQNGVRTGPYTLDEVRQRVEQGVLPPEGRAWLDGEADSQPVAGLLSSRAAGRPELTAVRYAGFWVRAAAVLIDVVVLLIPLLLINRLAPLRAGEPLSAATILKSLVWWAYTASLHASPWGATVGKKAVGIRVVDGNGARIGFGRATVRYLAGYLSAILLGFGFVMVAISERKQGLHDLIADTLVVKG